MKVLNVHSRVIECQKSQIDQLLESLTSREDKVRPSEHWPKIFFKDGFKIDSKGDYGPIRYRLLNLRKENYLNLNLLVLKALMVITVLKRVVRMKINKCLIKPLT